MDGFWLPSGNYTFLGLLAVEEQDGDIVEWETCRFDAIVPESCGAADSIYSESMLVAGVLGGISALCVFVSLVVYVMKKRRKRHARNSAPVVSSGSNERDEYHQQASV